MAEGLAERLRELAGRRDRSVEASAIAHNAMQENGSTEDLAPEEHESGVRKLMTACHGITYQSLRSLDEARDDPSDLDKVLTALLQSKCS